MKLSILLCCFPVFQCCPDAMMVCNEGVLQRRKSKWRANLYTEIGRLLILFIEQRFSLDMVRFLDRHYGSGLLQLIEQKYIRLKAKAGAVFPLMGRGVKRDHFDNTSVHKHGGSGQASSEILVSVASQWMPPMKMQGKEAKGSWGDEWKVCQVPRALPWVGSWKRSCEKKLWFSFDNGAWK